MKKLNIFGKSVPIFALVILGMAAIGTAALVGYISNPITANIEVSSPMVASISEGGETWGDACFPEEEASSSEWLATISIPNIHGGETVTLYTMSTNLANVEITGFENAIVTNLDGVTCSDFESVKVSVDSIYGSLCYGTEHDLIALGEVGCRQVTNDPNRVQFGTMGASTWGVGETDVTKMVVTFKTDAFGTYTFEGQILPV